MILDERNENEPEEPDPEAELEFDALDRASELGTNVPEPPPPPSPENAPEELRSMFWRVVLVLNVAILAASLGLMFVGFRGRLRLGGGLVAVGLLAGAHAYRIYRQSDYA